MQENECLLESRRRLLMECAVRLFGKGKGYSAYKVASQNLLENTFILCSKRARDILYSPHIAGKRLQDSLRLLSVQFADFLGKHLLEGAKKERICELVFLSGGLYYSLSYGFSARYSYALPQCFIGIQRSRVEGKEGEFRALASYENFESLPDKAHVIIGDTIATGSTLAKGIRLLLDAAEDKGFSIDSINVVTIAGSSAGARRLCELANSQINKRHPNCRVSLLACEMLFHLMPDGTDLRFLMPDSIMPKESMEEAERRYGKCLAKSMKCAVFDWGTRCKNPLLHYREFIEYCERELAFGGLDKKGQKVLERMKGEAESEMREMQKGLSD